MSDSLKIFCTNTGTYYDFPMGIRLQAVYDTLRQAGAFAGTPLESRPAVAARVNNRETELPTALYHPCRIAFFSTEGEEGMRVYLRTLRFLFFAAASELYPQADFHMEHAVLRGYFCHVRMGRPLEQEDVDAIVSKMRELAARDLPIETLEDEAGRVKELFGKRHREDMVSLLDSYPDLYTRYVRMGGYCDYFYGPLAASSGAIGEFCLRLCPGVVPEREYLFLSPYAEVRGAEVLIRERPGLLDFLGECIRRNDLLGVSNLGELNEKCRLGQAGFLIKVSEALQEKKIARLADEILQACPKKRVVLVAGPSSSGKTTFSKRLSIQFMTSGVRPIALSLDDYFLEREDTPLDANGEYDYESLYALDLDLFNRQLSELLAGREVNIPTYNFTTGHKEYHPEKRLRLADDQILIMEGIHALNPDLLPRIAPEVQYKIYTSVLTTLGLDSHNRISTNDNRLMRRLVRDAQFRGTRPEATLARWPSVRAGEEKWIYPHQRNADAFFNSALLFEQSVMRTTVENLLHQVPQSSPQFAEADRLLRYLRHISPLGDKEIPPTSLLREFLGGSSFDY